MNKFFYHHQISSSQLFRLLRNGEVKLAGNRKLKIYGRLDCSSGKRMKANNRVFFSSADEALAMGYRPCGHCMKEAYEKWKKEYGPRRHKDTKFH
ncbi:metal-binding protein [Flavihumibacter rivuli]|uniref:Ada metal-binding domain-containing protein n=1 Tax=Flavihumibacter rivuli TaxID=2838156 RepID=UPI001BDEB31D|nr:Ada metal-binding domain-containing protein [Flavihumibacter rivuli]ULQ55232.1 metal-binding protein [Flavihumibacter rivuli]